MNKQSDNERFPAGIQKVSTLDLLEDDGKNTAIDRLLQTREVRQALGRILPVFLNASAGNSRVKKVTMKAAGNYLNKLLSRPDDIFAHQELKRLFADERFAQNITEPLPEFLQGFFELLTTLMATIENLPFAERKEIINRLAASLSTGPAGEMINSFARIMINLHRDDPEFLTRALTPGLEKLIDGTDFGELKNFLNDALKDMTALVKAANGMLFERPAKLVLLLSNIPQFGNMLTKVFTDLFTRFNEFPPDLFADVILSILREVDAKTVALLTNETLELVRKIHIGSALIGNPGMPQARLDLTQFIEKVTADLDHELLWKVKGFLAQSREQFELSRLTVLKSRPDLVLERLRNAPELKNYQFKSANERLALLENMPEDTTSAALAEGIARVDANLMAEWVNLTTLLFNRLNDSDSDLLPGLVEEFISTLDLYEVEEAIKWTAANLSGALKPVGSILMPNLIKMAADWISDYDECDEELVQARKTIVRFLNHEEVTA